MGEHDVIEDDYNNKCPICKGYVKGEGAGFSNCSFKIVGKKFVQGKKPEVVDTQWQDVGNCYQRFDPDESGTATWLALKIIAKPISDQSRSQFDRDKGHLIQ